MNVTNSLKILVSQAQLTELHADNERLAEEKGVLLESLCRQTEKLEDSRSKVDTLQGLLLRDEQPQELSKGYNTEREQKLVDLLKVCLLNTPIYFHAPFLLFHQYNLTKF